MIFKMIKSRQKSVILTFRVPQNLTKVGNWDKDNFCSQGDLNWRPPTLQSDGLATGPPEQVSLIAVKTIEFNHSR